MRITPYSILFFLVLLQFNLRAQHPKINLPANASNRIDNAAVKSSLHQTPLSLEIPAGGNPNHAHTTAVHEPMPFITTPEALAVKAEKLVHKRYDESYHGSTPTSRVTPVIDASFEANLSVDETPSSNTIAISDDGIIVSANNDGVIYFTESGTRLYDAKWDDFFDDNQLTASFFSPRVLYDPVEERFILVTLHGKASSTSRVIISFSKSKNPEDGWNVYKLPGNPLGDGSWFDFASIGISTNEVYVSGNLIIGTTFNKAVVYQINKTDGYVASILDWQFWTDFFNGPISITPASYGHNGDYGPGIYLVSSAAAGDDAYWFWDLDNDIGGDPELIGYIVPCDAYSPPADASQSGSPDLLETGDARTTNAFYLDGIIHFTHNLDVGGGFSGIRYVRMGIQGLSLTTTQLGESGNADLAHASVASFATSASDRSVMISFLRTGASLFPEFRVVNVDGGMSWSSTALVKGGETYVDRLPGLEQWGTYTGIARRHNSTDPRTWSSGSVGANVAGQIDHTYKSWIGEVTNGQNVSTTEIDKTIAFSVSPNPVRDYMEINFTMTEVLPLKIALYDAQGQLVRILLEDHTPLVGEHKVSIVRGDLPIGAYVISFSSLGKSLGSEKIVVIEE
ncbi:MAG TPA: hypothetical protein VGK46_00635 [Saprospiraceae bacterium]